MQTKSQTTEALEWLSTLLKRDNVTIGAIRSDNGGEYTGAPWIGACRRLHVHREYSSPRTPQQNGKAERCWRTLKDATRTVLQAAQLTDGFWETAMATVCHVANRIPTANHPDTTPYGRYYGHEPDLSHLRVYGCLAFATVKDHRTAWQPKAEAGIFVGYDPAGYIIYMPKRNFFLRTKAVTFNED